MNGPDPPSVVDIIGSEVEWGLLGYSNGQPAGDFFGEGQGIRRLDFFCHGISPRLWSRHFAANPDSSILFIANGGKFHFDTGFHPEYAGPEARGPLRAVWYEKAGERNMENAVARVNKYWEKNDRGIYIRIFKNNLDESGAEKHACGTHVSFNLRRCPNTEPKHILDVAGLFFISTLFFTGNGRVALDDKTGTMRFELSQRAKLITSVLSGGTTSGRAIINTRDDPEAAYEKYRRLHLILFDSILAEPAMFLRNGATALVLEMVQNGFLQQSPVAVSPNEMYVEALHFYAEDVTLRKPFEFGDGKKYTMVDLQEMYFKQASRYCEGRAWAGAEDRASAKEVLFWWDRAIKAAKSPRPHEGLQSFADWALKLGFIEQDGVRRGYDFNTPYRTPLYIANTNGKNKKARASTVGMHVRSIDLQFPENSSRGLMRTLMRNGFVDRLLTDRQIEAARFMPLPNTRAYPRAVYWRRLERRARGMTGAQLFADWTFIGLKDRNGILVDNYGPMKEPGDATVYSCGTMYPQDPKPPEGEGGPEGVFAFIPPSYEDNIDS